jgi:hypothetical protein
MKPKVIAILTVLTALIAIFISFQNFSFEKGETDKADLSSMILDSETERGQTQKEVHKQAPPNRVTKEGLTASRQMKRVKLEGSEESVIVKDSNFVFPTAERDPANTFDSDLNKRLDQEFGDK